MILNLELLVALGGTHWLDLGPDLSCLGLTCEPMGGIDRVAFSMCAHYLQGCFRMYPRKTYSVFCTGMVWYTRNHQQYNCITCVVCWTHILYSV